jgi:hypothetical protein
LTDDNECSKFIIKYLFKVSILLGAVVVVPSVGGGVVVASVLGGAAVVSG